MKKLLVALGVVVALTVPAVASDDVSLHVKGGVNYIKLVDGSDSGLGFEGGAGLSLPLFENVDLNADLLVRYATSKQTYSATVFGFTFSGEVESKSVSVVAPITISYSLTDSFSVFGGAELIYLLSANAGGEDVKSAYKDFGFGLVAGGTYSVDELDFNLGYALAITDFNDAGSNGLEAKPQGIIASVGYNF